MLLNLLSTSCQPKQTHNHWSFQNIINNFYDLPPFSTFRTLHPAFWQPRITEIYKFSFLSYLQKDIFVFCLNFPYKQIHQYTHINTPVFNTILIEGKFSLFEFSYCSIFFLSLFVFLPLSWNLHNIYTYTVKYSVLS